MRKVLLGLVGMFFSVLCLEGDEYQYQLSIGAVFKDEAPFLKEWIEFHKLVGVEHFYLVNNCSQDEYLAILQPYLESGEVDLLEWATPVTSWSYFINEMQPRAYEMCVQRASGKSKWLAMIDIDEFLTPIRGDNLQEILKDYEVFGGVGFNWRIFGHSGLFELPSDKLMVESLIMSAVEIRETHLGIKSVVRPERVESGHNGHVFNYKEGFFHVNSNKNPCISLDGITDNVYYENAVVNHFWSRNGEYLYKKLKRYSAWFPHIVPENWIQYVDGMNEVHDHTMERFVPLLRQKLGFDD